MSRHRSRPPTKAALFINEFLISRKAGVKVEGDVTAESLKKAIKQLFSGMDLEVITNEGETYLINKKLVEASNGT